MFLLACTAEDLQPATIKDYDQKLRDLVYFLQTVCSVGDVRDVTPTDVRLYKTALDARMKPISASCYLRVARRWFNWHEAEGTIPQSPMHSIRVPKPKNKLVVPFNDSQVEDMVALCDAGSPWPGMRNKALLLVLVDGGPRLRELTDMGLDDVSARADRITIRRGKNNESRVIGLGKNAQKALLRYVLSREEHLEFHLGKLSRHERERSLSYLWLNMNGLPLRPQGVASMIKRLGQRAHVEGVRCSAHTFRHYCGTKAMRNGARQREVRDMLGHKRDDMTNIYTATIGSEDAAERHRLWSPGDSLRV